MASGTLLEEVEEQSEKRPGTSFCISPTRMFNMADVTGALFLTDDQKWFCPSNRARREGGYVHGRRIWDWVPPGRGGELERNTICGSHPFCVVVGTDKLSVDFLLGVHRLTRMPELTVHCVETLEVIQLHTLLTETTGCFAFFNGYVFF
jgi:hypothetical protein